MKNGTIDASDQPSQAFKVLHLYLESEEAATTEWKNRYKLNYDHSGSRWNGKRSEKMLNREGMLDTSTWVVAEDCEPWTENK